MRRFEKPWYRKPRFGPKMPRIPGGHGIVHCPERNENVLQSECLECPNYRIWHDGDVERCRYEYEELKEIGHYSDDEGQWLEHLRRHEPETYERLMEERENNERVGREMESERAKAESESKEKEDESKQSDKTDELDEGEDDDSDELDEIEDSFDDDEFPEEDEEDEKDEKYW